MFSVLIQYVIVGVVFMKALTKALTGIVICIFFSASFLIFIEPALGILPSTEVSFTTIDPGYGYNHAERENFAIRDATTWEELWLDLYSGNIPIPEVPFVNFTSEMLIAVFQGERTSGGYSTNITRVTVNTLYYRVYVDEMHPGEDCGTIAVMTYPYCIIKISDIPLNLPIQFVYNITVHHCE